MISNQSQHCIKQNSIRTL